MSAYTSWRMNKKNKLFQANRFKNRFLKAWLKYGTFTEIDGRKYLSKYRISGDSDGAILMSKILGTPTLHNDVEDKHISYTDIFLNFSKLLKVDAEHVEAWLNNYKEQLSTKNFNKLYYKINEQKVEEAYFIEIVDEEENKIEDDFLDGLALDLAERRRADFYKWGCHCIDFGVTYEAGEFKEITEIEYSELVTIEDVEDTMNRLDDVRFYNWEDNSVTYFMPSIRDKVMSFSIENQIGVDILNELGFVHPVFQEGSYVLEYDKAKRMNGEAFLALIIKIIDFDSHEKSKYFWRHALVGFATVVVGGIIIVYTGNVYTGFAFMTGTFGTMMNSKELKIISSILSLGSMDIDFLNVGVSFMNLGYEEAIELVMNIGSIYYVLRTPQITSS